MCMYIYIERERERYRMFLSEARACEKSALFHASLCAGIYQRKELSTT